MKRFTETNKWEDPWFRRLKPEMKLLWAWLLDSCDNAGVIDIDIELASFQVGYQYPIDTLSEFGQRVIKLPCGKFFIPKFIEFQYGNLSPDCKAHNPIFSSLEKHGLKGYPKGIHTLQEKEKEKEEETETEKVPKKPKSEKLLKPFEIPDDEWMASLKTNPDHEGKNIDSEFRRAHEWCLKNNRQNTRRFFENWISKVEKPLTIKPKPKPPESCLGPSGPWPKGHSFL
jgi:hypothetical protein